MSASDSDQPSQRDSDQGPSRRGEDLESGVGRLVIALIDVLRQLMERQAENRIESGNLSEEEVERLGQSFMLLEDRMKDVKRVFSIDENEDLDLELGTIDGERVSIVELADRVLNRGVAVQGDIGLSIAEIDLLFVGLRAVIASPETVDALGYHHTGVAHE